MDTFIDDIASEWGSDIKGNPVQVGNGNVPDDVKMPGATMMSSDVTIYHQTSHGGIKFGEGMSIIEIGLLLRTMEEGLHYVPVGTVPYRPTPDDLFGSKEERVRPLRSGKGKMYKQAPLRVRH